jgi:HK97 family phage portal protein
MTSYTWRKTTMLHLLTWGNGYSEQVRNGYGELVALETMRPDRMQKVAWEGGARVYYYRNADGEVVRMTQDQVFHVPGLSFDGLVGKPPLTLMRETLGSFSAAREYGSSFFRNGARPAVVVKHPKTMTNPAIERLTAQFDRLRGSGNAGKTILLEEGADFQDVGFPPEDAQFIQTKDHELGEFATWFGVPPHMVGLTDRSTSWGTGIEQQTLGFFLYTMDDWLVNWEQSYDTQLLWDTGVTSEHTRDAMLRGDTATRFAAYKLGRDMGIYSPNRILRLENQEPRTDPGGDEYLRPLNFAAEGSMDASGNPVVRTIAVADARPMPTMPDPGMIQQGEVPV